MGDNGEETIMYEKLSPLAREMVHETLAGLPAVLRAKVDQVPVFLEWQPDEADIASGIFPDTLGLFDEGSSGIPTPRIRLWLGNIWDYSDNAEIFRQEIHTTLLHEIGHFLGWDEDEVEERGLG